MGERVNESTIQYTIDWAAFREFWGGYRDSSFEGSWDAERRELADAMVSVRCALNNPPEVPSGG